MHFLLLSACVVVTVDRRVYALHGVSNVNEVEGSEASPTDLSVDLRIFEQNYGPTDKRQKPTDKIGSPDS